MSTLNRKHDKRLGLSLVEVVMATMIVGVMLVASLDTVGAVYRTQKINATRLTGPGLAQELMGEILSMPYEDPEEPGNTIGRDSGESGGNRLDFDDVDDYHGWSSTNAEAKDGVALAGYSDWQRQVAVKWADPVNENGMMPMKLDLKSITVTVTDPSGVQTTISALRYKNGVLEQSPAIDTTAITWIGAELRLGNNPQPARAGTHLSNHAVDSN